jgi:ubiquinone/menaquinone biosynthesis C-methylase UbiE
MEPLIRLDLKKVIDSGQRVVIDLGCGPKKKPGRIGINKVDLPNVDIVADLEEGLAFLPDNSVDEIHCRSLLPLIVNFEHLMSEIVRVMKKDGRAYVFVAHFSNPYYYSDFAQKRFFGLYTFYYFVDSEKQPKRKVPNFYTDIRIRILSQKLKFRSSFKILNPLKSLVGRFINLHSLIQEYYEENLCYLFPCHGIEIVFTPDS